MRKKYSLNIISGLLINGCATQEKISPIMGIVISMWYKTLIHGHNRIDERITNMLCSQNYIQNFTCHIKRNYKTFIKAVWKWQREKGLTCNNYQWEFMLQKEVNQIVSFSIIFLYPLVIKF